MASACITQSPLALPDSVSHWVSHLDGQRPGDLFFRVVARELAEQGGHLAVQQALQQGLRQGSHVGPSALQVRVLRSAVRGDVIEVKAGIFYTGIIAGCSCADDPTPVDELSEYCELLLRIDCQTALADVELLDD